jgi:hypothetical protein
MRAAAVLVLAFADEYYNPETSPWWRLQEESNRAGAPYWQALSGHCALKPIDISALDAGADLCAAKCTGKSPSGTFCDGYSPAFDTMTSGAICGDLALCERRCLETRGCFGFAYQTGAAAKPRCFLYPESCSLGEDWASNFIADPEYATLYQQRAPLDGCSLGEGVDVVIPKEMDHHDVAGIYVAIDDSSFGKYVVPSYVGPEVRLMWDPCGRGWEVKIALNTTRRRLDECTDDLEAAAKVLGLSEPEPHLCSPHWAHCTVEAYARACRRTCKACELPAIEGEVDVAHTRQELYAARRLSNQTIEYVDPFPGSQTLYATFDPDELVASPLPFGCAIGENYTTDANLVVPPDQLALKQRYHGLYDWWAEYQPVHGVTTQKLCPSVEYLGLELKETYCPHNNIMNAALDSERCVKKCRGTGDARGASGTPGFCMGNADTAGDPLTEDSNALCLNRERCDALCAADPECSGIDMHKFLPRCYLNGPHCAIYKYHETIGGPREPHPDYDLWAKKESKRGGFKYSEGTCEGEALPEQLTDLFYQTARPKLCEKWCTLWYGYGMHCGGFIYRDQTCFFFYDQPCNATLGGWADDESSSSMYEAVAPLVDYFPDTWGTFRRLSGRSLYDHAGRPGRPVHPPDAPEVVEVYYYAYYMDVTAYYQPDWMGQTFAGPGTCNATCENILPSPGSYVATLIPPKQCEVQVSDPTDQFGGRYVATSGSLKTFDRDDHMARLQWKGGVDENCDGWVVSENLEEVKWKMAYDCYDLDTALIKGLDGVPDDFINCVYAKLHGGCADPFVSSVCRSSCHPEDHAVVKETYDVEHKKYISYTSLSPCTNREENLDAFFGAPDCASLVHGDATVCANELVSKLCQETCAGVGMGEGFYIVYRDTHHEHFYPHLQTWPRGAGTGFEDKEPSFAATYLEEHYVDHVGLGACIKTNMSEANATVGFNYMLGLLTGDYWYTTTPYKEDLGLGYVCGVPPSCTTMTTCVLSEYEFKKELTKFRTTSSPFDHRLTNEPLWRRYELLHRASWADKMSMDADRSDGFGKILVTAGRAEMIYRVADYPYGRQIFRSEPYHSRVMVDQFPKTAHTVSFMLSSTRKLALLDNVGFTIPELPGYNGWKGDLLRLEMFTEAAEVVKEGMLVLDILQPGTEQKFGLKVFAVYAPVPGKSTSSQTLDLIKVGGSVVAIDKSVGLYRVSIPAKLAAEVDFVTTEDIDECKSGLAGCEADHDGGMCEDKDGFATCGCKPGFQPLKGHCIQSKWVPSEAKSPSILLYPQDKLTRGWRINEVFVFEKYDANTKTCMGICQDGTMSSECHYRMRIGGVNSLVKAKIISDIDASKPFPGFDPKFGADADPTTGWMTEELIVDRAVDTGGWFSFKVNLGGKIVDPECVRVVMPTCGTFVPQVLVAHKGVGAITTPSPTYESDDHTFPRPGWTKSTLQATEGKTTVDIPLNCGVKGQYFGELLFSYKGVPSACQCKQLCLEHVDEGCETWKWYSEPGAQICYLREDIFVGSATDDDSLSGLRASQRDEGLYLDSEGWWRRSFSPNWEGWITGDTGPLITSLETEPASVTVKGKLLISTKMPFSLTLKGLGFPSDTKGLDRQRIKIIHEHEPCATTMPPPEVSGIRCTNWFTCAPKPVKGSRRSATWEGISIGDAKEMVSYKVCWCPGECWNQQMWTETTGRLETVEADYVWSSSVEPPVNRKDSPMTFTVTRRPFATTSPSSAWELKVVRAVFSCALEGDAGFCSGACGVGAVSSPDEAVWTVTLAMGTLPGDYQVCFNDGSGWIPLPSADGSRLTVELLAQDSSHPRGLFHEQRVSATQSLAKVALKGYSMLEPFPGQLGVVPCTPDSCTSMACSDPTIAARLLPVGHMSDQETAVFEGDLNTLAVGTYHLCYCNEDAYEALDEPQRTFTGTPLSSAALGAYANELCVEKCSVGCVGPTCFCDGFMGQEVDANSSALCLSSIGCRDACDAVGGCVGFAQERGRNRCFLYGSTDTEETDRFFAFQKSEYWPSGACQNTTGFAATTGAEIFEKSIGTLTVTGRISVGVDFVVTPGEPASLELAGQGLDAASDRIMVIECSDQCGLAEGSSDVTAPTRPVDAYFAEYGKADTDELMPLSDYAPPFVEYPEQYCHKNNLRIASSPSLMVTEHQCYRKCEAKAPCLDDACFCDGYFPGHDMADSTALCLPEDQCMSMCTHDPNCFSIDMHATLPRCFLNSAVCASGLATGKWTSDPDYKHLVKTGRRLGDLEKMGRRLSADHVRSLLQTPNYGLSWSELLRFDGLTFKQAGTYKVCACDSEISGKCSSKEDFTVEVGKVHASGLQCLLGKPEFARGSCVKQKYGGLRCYDGDAPTVVNPFDDLHVPLSLSADQPYLFGAGTEVFEKVRAFCNFGTNEPRKYDFCATVINTPYGGSGPGGGMGGGDDPDDTTGGDGGDDDGGGDSAESIGQWIYGP